MTALSLLYLALLDAARAASIAVGMVALFLVWDGLGVAFGVFSCGDSPYMTGIELAPDIPLEEPFFLFFLTYLTLNLTTAARRLLNGRVVAGAGSESGGTDNANRTANRTTNAAERTPLMNHSPSPRSATQASATLTWKDKLRAIFSSSRTISWINTAFPFGAAYLLVGGRLDWVFVVGVLFFLIPYNIAMYGINDVFDYESEILNPCKGGVEGAVLDKRLHPTLLWASAITVEPLAIILYAAGTPASAFWLTVSLAAVLAYSAPVLRFKERPVLDSITSSTHFVTPALVGGAMARGCWIAARSPASWGKPARPTASRPSSGSSWPLSFSGAWHRMRSARCKTSSPTARAG